MTRRIVSSIVASRWKLPVQLVSASTKLRQTFYTQIERRTFHTASFRQDDERVMSASSLRRRLVGRAVTAGQESQCQSTHRQDRDQLLDADGADHLDADRN